MREVIVGIVGEIKALEARLQAVKGDFEAFLVDKAIPLNERWQVWEDAPESLKNTGGWVSDGRLDAFKLLMKDPRDAIGYDGTLMHAERYETVTLAGDYTMECLVEYLLDRFEITIEDDEFDWGDLDAIGGLHPEIGEFLTAYREELLAKNLYSFTYDW